MPHDYKYDDGAPDGARSAGVLGTYLHGAFETREVCQEVFGAMPDATEKQADYDRMADWLERHLRHGDALGVGLKPSPIHI